MQTNCKTVKPVTTNVARSGRLVLTLIVTLLTSATAWAEITGSGTAAEPYVLNEAADWATFASNVYNGTNADKFYKLSDTWDNTASAVTATVGTESHPFTGTFDGNSKTLTVNISETSTQGTAPFRYISGGAVIKKVTITGSVTGTTHAAGLVGFSKDGSSEGPNIIEGCTVSASITVNTGDNKHMGGVVGHGLSSYLKIKDTVFDGTMSNGGNYAGGLQGWSDGNHLTLDNCIFKGSYSGNGSFHPIAIHNQGSTTTATVSAAYYTVAPTLTDAAFIAAAGTRAYSSTPAGTITDEVTAADGNTYYIVTGYSIAGSIATAEDWDTFAASVSAGANYEGMTVTLVNDITVSTMVGTNDHKFSGTFEGGGKTLTLSLTADGSEYTAPFRYVNGATIKCLHTAGTVDGAGQKYASGLIGQSEGAVTVASCRSSVAITSSISGDGTHGGFIGTAGGTVTFTNCLFDGSIAGGNTTNCGGFVGWRNGTLTFNNCLMAGTMSLSDTSGSATFNRNGSSTLNNCYYKTAYGDVQGNQTSVTGSELQALIGSGWEVSGSSVVPILNRYSMAGASVSGLKIKYLYDNGNAIAISYIVTDLEDVQLTAGTHFNAVITKGGETVTTVTAKGDYVLTLTGLSPYTGTKTLNFTVSDADFTISNAADWATFAQNVEGGETYSGKYVRLADNFDNSATPIQTMVGTSDHRFCGTFLGNGRTLTVSLSATTDNCAPFGYIDGATIHDLTVAGTITTSKKFAASIAAHTYGTTTITHCSSTVVISSSVSGDGTNGGFVAVNEGSATLTFTNCAFRGSLLGTNTTSNGGFVGWNAGTKIRYTDCLFAPAELTMSTSSSSTFNRNGNNELTRCYYTQTLGTAEGTQIFTTPQSDFCKQVTFDGIDYYQPGTAVITTPTHYDYADGSAIDVTPVLTFDGAELAADCYVATITKDGNAVTTVTEKGRYTLTITGEGSKGYCGGVSIDIFVMSALGGSGTVDAPYLIGDGADWERFALNISTGTDADKYYQLTADIDGIETMVGTNDHKFSGTFYGGGHTLTLNLTADGSEYTAPFRYVNGATIKCLHTAGTVDGAGQKYASGLIGQSEGAVTVASCRSSVAITSSISGDGTHGGFIGTSGGTVTFTNCLFDGSISGDGTTNCGGFVGWRNATLTFTNCLMAGTMAISQTDGSALFNRNGSSTLTNCYYDASKSYGAIATQGTATDTATAAELQALLGSGWEVNGERVVPVMDVRNLSIATLSDVDTYYIRTGIEIMPEPTVTAADGKVLTKGTDYTVAWSGDGRTDGTYAVIVTGAGSYTGSLSASYVVSIVPRWLRIDTSKNPGEPGYYYLQMPTSGTYTYEINDGFEEPFQVRWSHGGGTETGTITLTAPTGRKMTFSGAWTKGSIYNDCHYTIKEGNETKSSGYNDKEISETTTAFNSLSIECYHRGTAGKLTLNVKMVTDPIRISGLAEFYAYTGSVISAQPTVSDADKSTTLTAGTDYDVTFSPTEVKDKGVYTATISGKGNYAFTKTLHFYVGTLDYVDADGATQTKDLGDLKLLTTRDALPAPLTGWYLVADNISFSSVVEVSGEAHLILADGTTMNANRIRVNSGNTLNIYGQTGGTGSLSVYPKGVVSNDAGIGSSQGNSCGAITINGGNINSEGMFSGAGIGAAPYNSCGTVTINGGVVTAKGKGGIADIGGEYGSVVINGGQITATSGGIGASTVSLGWRDAAGDFIQAEKYSGEVSFQTGKPFILDDGTNVDATADNIGGKKIVPKSGTITYDLKYATINGIEKAYAPTDAGISLQYSVVYTGNATLQEGTDYTAAITDGNSHTVDVIRTPGRYTLTITGTGSFTGTTTATIVVYGFKETLGGYEFSTSGDDDGLYYFVDSEAALRAIATYVNSGNDAYGKRFVQTQDIVMTGGNFTPIGKHQTGGELFDGIYDGRNHVISDLVVTHDYGYIGLFGGIGNVNRGATVKNVVLVNPTVTATNSGPYSADVGALVASCNDNATVDNCMVINPTVTISGTNKVAGAIVGMLYFNTNRLTNSYFYDSNASHSYAALGSNDGSHVSNVERVYTMTATGCTATATATVAAAGTDYYKSGTPVTVTAAVPSSGMKKFTCTGTTASLTETLGQYTLTMPAGDVTLSLADVTPTITVADGSTYTGAAQTPAITSVKDGETVMTEGTDYTDVAYTDNINAGTATVAITGKGFYLGAAAQTFGIARRSVTLTSASGSKTYDGTALTAGGVTVGGDGFAQGEGATCDVTGTLTDVGSYPNAFNYTLNDGTRAANYDITKVEGTLTVTPLTGVTVTITGHTESATYDGSAHTATGYDVAISSQLYTSADFTFSGTAQASLTDTGIAYMGLAAGQFANTNPNFADVTFSVTDGSVTISYHDASFADHASNTDAISDIITKYGGKATVTLAGRTLWKDGDWNTLCLPFDVDDFTGTPLEGATVMELDVTNTSFDDATGTLYLYFVNASAIEAGTPYIIKWASGDDIVSPVFEGVTVSTAAASTVQSADGKVQFIGTYNPVDIYSDAKDNLFLGAGNQLYWPEGEGMTSYLMNTFRAYFHVGDGQTAAPVRHTVLNFGDDTTGVIAIDNGQWMMDNEADAWYDISGRRLDAAPAARGIYIVNGKKVVIK